MRYLEDHITGQVYPLGSQSIQEQDIIGFAKQYDPQYYHIDPEQAANSVFAGLIASGWHIAALWMKLYVETMLHNTAVEGSPGVDHLSWKHPVRPGDILFGEVTIIRAHPSLSQTQYGILENHGTLHNAEGTQVMQLTLYSLCKKRSLS